MSCESCKKYIEALDAIAKLALLKTMEDEPMGKFILALLTVHRIAENALDSIPEPVEENRTCGNCYSLITTQCIVRKGRVCPIWSGTPNYKPRPERKETK